MLAHLSYFKEPYFVGYGNTENCPKCNNSIVLEIFCIYSEWRSLFVRAGSDAERPIAICPICGLIFADDSNFDKLKKILWVGREKTKLYYQSLNYFSQKKLLRVLKKLNFSELLTYLKT